MRSGKIIAINDYLIEELIVDPLFTVGENGEIYKESRGRKRKVGSPDKEGYIRVKYKNKRVFAHRIVYRKFKGKLHDDLVVEHKDGNPDNNAPYNLLLVTQKKNNEYKIRRKERTGK